MQLTNGICGLDSAFHSHTDQGSLHTDCSSSPLLPAPAVLSGSEKVDFSDCRMYICDVVVCVFL